MSNYSLCISCKQCVYTKDSNETVVCLSCEAEYKSSIPIIVLQNKMKRLEMSLEDAIEELFYMKNKLALKGGKTHASSTR